nr:hypothetical protein [Tanacetum cinerariifolium]
MITDKDSSVAGTDNRPPMLEENDYESWRIRSGQTLERRKEALFDEFERFRANGNELIQDYFVHFHKLIIDMKVTQLDIPTHQLNTKFANNLPSYWALLMQAKEKGAVLDAEAKAFLAVVECTALYDQPLALTTTNLFKANHEDAYDSNVDEGPHASA